jgi:hypothetical protein
MGVPLGISIGGDVGRYVRGSGDAVVPCLVAQAGTAALGSTVEIRAAGAQFRVRHGKLWWRATQGSDGMVCTRWW